MGALAKAMEGCQGRGGVAKAVGADQDLGGVAKAVRARPWRRGVEYIVGAWERPWGCRKGREG